MKKKERLDKIISNAKWGSRKEIKKEIRNGEVEVNGEIIKDPSTRVNKEKNNIKIFSFDVIPYHPVYLMLNKPRDYVCSRKDKYYPLVFDLVDHDYVEDLSMAGRLDVDTEGMILFSNDGKFIHNIIHPKKEVYKTYYVQLNEKIGNVEKEKLEKGVNLGDFVTSESLIEFVSDSYKDLYIKIKEGKFHQVKRMFETVGREVKYLKRIAIGKLKLDVESGSWRELTQKDIDKIFSSSK